jgi:hypothetical protein
MGKDCVTTYPLTGIRSATTAPQRALLERACAVLQADDQVLAAWLVGTFAYGEEDPWSDLDVHCCVTDEAAAQLAGDGWKAVLGRITPTVMATTFPPGTIGGYSLTPEWTHIDLVFVPRSMTDASKLAGFAPLFDRTGELLPDLPVPPAPIHGEPYFPPAVVDWFFYMLGNLVTVVGRNEPVLATLGSVTIRDYCLVPLFCAERGVRRAGGAKRLRPFLSEEQHQILQSLPPIEATLDGVIEAALTMARIFVPRGRALAERTGGRWPAELEAATLAHVSRGLGIEVVIPSGP